MGAAFRTPVDQSAEYDLPFTETAGNLVSTWGLPDGGSVVPGYNVSTLLNLTIAEGAPVGDYSVTLELIDGAVPAKVLASETGTIAVNANAPTVLWGDSVPKLATQGVTMAIPLTVYSPEVGTGQLDLTVTGPAALAAGDVKIYASDTYAIDGVDMVSMPLTLVADNLEGTWEATLLKGYTSVTWYATVAEGAPVGDYAFGVSLEGGNTLSPLVVAVAAPDAHGEKPPDVGDDTTAPTVTITAADTTVSTTATFELTASEADVTFECMLTTNGVAGPWESCTSPKTYTGLQPGSYTFSARATDTAKNVGEVEVYALVIPAPPATQQPSAGAAPAPAAPPAAGAPTAQVPSATTPVVPAAVVNVTGVSKNTKLFVDVDPNKGKGYWKIKVYRKVVKGDAISWKKVGKTLRTQTSKETRTITLKKGTYRVQVMAKYGMQGATSAEVTLGKVKQPVAQPVPAPTQPAPTDTTAPLTVEDLLKLYPGNG